MIISKNLDETIYEYELFYDLATKCGVELGKSIMHAVVDIIPGIDFRFQDGNIGELFFWSDTYDFEPEDANDLEKNYKTLSQVVVEVFPELDGVIFDDILFLNSYQQAEVKKSLQNLKK